ncbi:helix-turn-helix transcriptional regulator [Saccharomonospora halophila]|uniref:helix-turn-helix transcriptional regulator n=1 Tax=Saccharomonospora halophila TaxID=129922 RepID=UPI00036703FA|nr:helix-turn-helix transcriptional regulator [Saccharomonospora halophila]
MSESPTTFAEKLAFLIETMHPDSRGPYDDEELARALGVSRQYVWQLRTGRRDEPRHSVAMKIVRFFGVPDDYFVNDDTTVAVMRQVQDLLQRRDGATGGTDPRDDVELRRLTLRILGLSAEERETVSSVVEEIRSYEARSRHHRPRRKPARPDGT